MKILYSLIYIAVLIPLFYLSAKQQRMADGGKISQGRSKFLFSIFSYLTLVIIFFQFWLLTNMFPLKLILIIFAANIVTLIVTLLIGAISGFGLKDKKEKVIALTYLWGVEKKERGCIALIFGLIVLLLVFVAPLVIYWMYPAGSQKVIVLISFFQFTLLQIFSTIMMILMDWSQLTSSHADDDLRNSRLTSGFTRIIYSTIYLLFPLWIFNGNIEYIEHTMGLKLPDFWILISLPIILFVFGSLIPFYIGMYRHRSEAKHMNEWKKRWLEDAESILNMPAGAERESEWKVKVEELQNEVKKKSEENELLRFYINTSSGLLYNEMSLGEEKKLIPLNVENSPQGEIVVDDKKNYYKQQIAFAKDFIRGKTPFSKPVNPGLENIFNKIESYKTQLVGWDIRFGYLNQLLTILGIVVDGDNENLKVYLLNEIRASDTALLAIGSKKNWLASIIISGLSGIIIFFFNHYETNVVNFITQMVNK